MREAGGRFAATQVRDIRQGMAKGPPPASSLIGESESCDEPFDWYRITHSPLRRDPANPAGSRLAGGAQ
ncbi:hypothetical protein AERO9A_220131 [Aeromonas salmonicida]|nr:hypothetical protein AERO9A_220131 [Aeromonas salmonicida]